MMSCSSVLLRWRARHADAAAHGSAFVHREGGRAGKGVTTFIDGRMDVPGVFSLRAILQQLQIIAQRARGEHLTGMHFVIEPGDAAVVMQFQPEEPIFEDDAPSP